MLRHDRCATVRTGGDGASTGSVSTSTVDWRARAAAHRGPCEHGDADAEQAGRGDELVPRLPDRRLEVVGDVREPLHHGAHGVAAARLRPTRSRRSSRVTGAEDRPAARHQAERERLLPLPHRQTAADHEDGDQRHHRQHASVGGEAQHAHHDRGDAGALPTVVVEGDHERERAQERDGDEALGPHERRGRQRGGCECHHAGRQHAGERRHRCDAGSADVPGRRRRRRRAPPRSAGRRA